MTNFMNKSKPLSLLMIHYRINDRNCQRTKRERINRRQGCWPELQGAVRFWGLSLVRGCLAMRGLSGWLRFKDTTVDKPPTRLEKGRGGRHGLRAEEEGAGLPADCGNLSWAKLIAS